MPKNQKKQVIYCVEHQFSLTPLRDDIYLKQSATLSYCKGKFQSKTKSKQHKKQMEQNCACCPIFNKDSNYATSSFILPQEQQNFIENSQKLKLEHQHRVCDYNQQKSNMYIPKPKSKYSYCSTCRINYDDYLEHVLSLNHKTNANKSKFSSYIRELQKKYQKQIKNKNMEYKYYDGTSATNFISQTDICIQQLGQPTKKVKRTHQISENANNVRFNNTAFPNISTFQPMPLNSFNHNPIYPNYHPYRPQQLYPNGLPASFNQLPPYGFQMYNPYICWNPYHELYNNISLGMGMGMPMPMGNMGSLGGTGNLGKVNIGCVDMYNSPCKPLVIDLQADNK